jgi:hypothetical protein
VKLTTHLQLVPRSRCCGYIHTPPGNIIAKIPSGKKSTIKTTKIAPAQMLLLVIHLCGNKMYGGVGFPICNL